MVRKSANYLRSDLEGLVMDREVRALRDQFVTFNYSKVCPPSSSI